MIQPFKITFESDSPFSILGLYPPIFERKIIILFILVWWCDKGALQTDGSA